MFYQDLDDGTVAELIKDLQPRVLGLFEVRLRILLGALFLRLMLSAMQIDRVLWWRRSIWSTLRRQVDSIRLIMLLALRLGITLLSVCRSGLRAYWLKKLAEVSRAVAKLMCAPFPAPAQLRRTSRELLESYLRAIWGQWSLLYPYFRDSEYAIRS